MTSDTALRPRCLTTLSDGMTLKHDQLVQKLIEKLVWAVAWYQHTNEGALLTVVPAPGDVNF